MHFSFVYRASILCDMDDLGLPVESMSEVGCLLCAGILCDLDDDECRSSPCQNKGVCIDLVNSFKCICPAGYYDYICASRINEW